MKEKIKELAERAGFTGESMFPVFGTTQETALTLFAELIAKECARVVEFYVDERTMYYADLAIENHFGV